MRYELSLAAGRELWAIRQDTLCSYLSVEIEAVGRPPKLPAVKGNVAIIPIYGAISQRSSIWQEMFGGASTQQIQASYVRAVNDERIGAVVFDVDSPGGTVAGVQEAADIIHAGSQIKPTYAVANSDCCSAAYWLASQVGTGKLIAAPGAEVGSIGVFAMHEDISEAMARDGRKVTTFSMPEYKTELSPYGSVSDDAKGHVMGQIAESYDHFVEDVARGRGISASKVKAEYGKGRYFHAESAKTHGMVDRIATLPEVVAELMRASKGANAVGAEASILEAFASGNIETLIKPTSKEIRARRAKYLDWI